MSNQFSEVCVISAPPCGRGSVALADTGSSSEEMSHLYSRLLVTYCSSWKLMQCWGQQEFAIPDNVLGIVYGQTICWIGAFFSPLLPAIATLKFIIIFYVKEVRRGMHGGLTPCTIFDLARAYVCLKFQPHPVRCIETTSLI